MTPPEALALVALIMITMGITGGILTFVGVLLVRREALEALAEQDCFYERRRSFERNMTAVARR